MRGSGKDDDRGSEIFRLLDENEQLRTALETALEEHAVITEDRDRLLHRVASLASELRVANAAHARVQQQDALIADGAELEKRSQAEEELRVAFEELQVLTEELEASNTMLHQTNVDLDISTGIRC